MTTTKKLFWKRSLQNGMLLIISTLIGVLLIEWISRFYTRHSYTHVVDNYGNISSMQKNPGTLTAGLVPNFQGRMISGEFDVAIRLDSLGFRSPLHYGDIQNDSPLKIILLGDSFMFGWGVEIDSSFAGQLAKQLSLLTNRPILIDNLSIPGTGQFTHLRTLRKAVNSEIDFVIAGLYVADHPMSGNDLIDNLNDFYALVNDTISIKRKMDAAKKVGFLRQSRRWLKKHSNLYRLVETRLGSVLLAKLSGSMQIQRDEQMMEKAWQATDSLLIELNREAQRRNAHLICQYIPNLLDAANQNHHVYEKLASRLRPDDIKITPDPLAVFNRHRDKFVIGDYYYLVDGHWTPLAHRLCAKEAARYIFDLIDRQ